VSSVKAGLLYFTLVFSIGFVLGPIRVLWAVPRFGERSAELMEAPLMLAAIVIAAGWISRRVAAPKTSGRLLVVGLLALALLVAAELTVVLALRGLTLAEYVQSRDPAAGAVYLGLLALFALMPMLAGVVSKRQDRISSSAAR
jgi:hypothetical protein